MTGEIPQPNPGEQPEPILPMAAEPVTEPAGLPMLPEGGAEGSVPMLPLTTEESQRFLPVAEETVGLDALREIMQERGLEVRKFGFPSSVQTPVEGVSEDLERIYSNFNLDGKEAAAAHRAILAETDPAKARDLRREAIIKQRTALVNKGFDLSTPTDQELYENMGSYLTPAEEPDLAIRQAQLARLLDPTFDDQGSAHLRAERQRRRIAYIHAVRSDRDGINYALEGEGFEPSGYLHTRGLDLENQPISSRHGVEITPRMKKHTAHPRGPASRKARLEKEYQPRLTVAASRRVGSGLRTAGSGAGRLINALPPVKATKSLAGKLKPKGKPGQTGPRRKL